MHKPIYKVLKMLLLFGIAFVLLDFSIGTILNYLTVNQKDGNYHKLIDGLENRKSDILIVGNSRAERQFIPSIIFEETGLETYNLGYGGRDLNFVNALTAVIAKRNPPKYLMIEFQLSNFRMPIKYDRMSFLNPFYHEYPELQSFLNRDELSRKIAFNSSLFQYNSSLWDIISPYFLNEDLELGYRPLYGTLNSNKIKLKNEDDDDIEKEKMLPEIQTIFENIVSETAKKNITVIIVLSPLYKKEFNSEKFNSEKEFLSKFNEILIWDYSQEPRFTLKPELYNDVRHLNHRGAQIFNKLLADRIKQDLLN